MKLKSIFSFVWETFKLALLALLIVIPIRYFIFQPFVVKGASMEPNFFEGNYLIVDEISYRFLEPNRGEVIVFKYPSDPSQRFIKRVVGLPGEQVEVKENQIIITQPNGRQFILEEGSYLSLISLSFLPTKTKIILGSDQYFVLGDNRDHSFDSRGWGALPRKDIIGRVIFRAWPLSDFGFIAKPTYRDN